MDSLESVATILTTLKKKELPIYVYDVSFKLELCEKFEKEFNIHFSIDLPEVGLIATACDKSSYPAKIFHPVLNIIIEIVGKRLVVTQLIPLPTPIIKYKINAVMMVAKEVTHDCDCANKNYSFMLT